MNYRKLTADERKTLINSGSHATSWDNITVTEDFTTAQIIASHLDGQVAIGRGARIINSYVSNYSLGDEALIDSVVKLECRARSRFGNGTEVATINENGGRSVKITTALTAQIAYLWALWRHEGDFIARLDDMAERYADGKAMEMGHVGARSKIIGTRFVRETYIGDDVVVDGASLLEDGSLLSGARVGIDVKMRHFIAVEHSRIDSGVSIERCLVGERTILASGFSAVDSLFFANSHCENGEAASIFAGPYTVSHHKSSLLIAGLFSFFNAGSGSNQSNHLFKCGPVHQAIHPRGCKFASGAYIMAPAIEGAYTMVKGYHAKHHDTSDFPFSYLIDDGARSMLMPGANLVSYGTMRDTQKWAERDRRTVCRDNISLKGENPYLTGLMLRAVNTIHTMQEENPKADEYIHGRVVIRPAHLRRGLGFYNKSIVASLGAMLAASSEGSGECNGGGEWIDAAGQYLTKDLAKRVIDATVGGSLTSFEQIANEFNKFHNSYNSYAYSYAYQLLSQLLGHSATEQDIANAIASGNNSREGVERQALNDRDRDNSLDMSVGYGFDCTDAADREVDFRAVRGL